MGGNFRRNQLILVGSLAAILLLFVMVYWLPQRRRLARLENDIKQTQQQLLDQEKKASQLPLLHTELSQLEAYNRHNAERVPQGLDVSEFLGTMASVGKKEGVTVGHVTPQPANNLVSLQEQSYRINLAGSFPAVVRVIHQLETAKQLLEITDLHVIRALKARDGDDSVQATVELRLFARPPSTPSSSRSSG